MTLVWNRQYYKTTINNLDLFLYNHEQRQFGRLEHQPG